MLHSQTVMMYCSVSAWVNWPGLSGSDAGVVSTEVHSLDPSRCGGEVEPWLVYATRTIEFNPELGRIVYFYTGFAPLFCSKNAYIYT